MTQEHLNASIIDALIADAWTEVDDHISDVRPDTAYIASLLIDGAADSYEFRHGIERLDQELVVTASKLMQLMIDVELEQRDAERSRVYWSIRRYENGEPMPQRSEYS